MRSFGRGGEVVVVKDGAIIAVVGPTATGKSTLAVELAQSVNGEIGNADSMQLYAGMDIGTAKAGIEERHAVSHHLLDVWSVTKSAAVAEYQQLARAAIADIHRRGRVAILVGGSGLYVRGVLDELNFPGESPIIRARLADELAALGPEPLHARLARLDPAAAAAIQPGNGRRIIRALEVIELTGGPFAATMPPFVEHPNQVQLGLERADLDDRVGSRVATMMQDGFLEEVRALLPAGLRNSPTAGKALGYAQLLACLDDDGAVVGDLNEAVAITIRATRRFARRQRSWFRRDPRVQWLDAGTPDLMTRALASVRPTLER
jgi:tRNA dimethylallyltransferase